MGVTVYKSGKNIMTSAIRLNGLSYTEGNLLTLPFPTK
jgi:hypothetical protein